MIPHAIPNAYSRLMARDFDRYVSDTTHDTAHLDAKV